MATWIFILHLVFPLSSTLPTPSPAASEPDPAAEVVRYRGLEQMFARFESEAEGIELID